MITYGLPLVTHGLPMVPIDHGSLCAQRQQLPLRPSDFQLLQREPQPVVLPVG